ncbi:hypothetical protein ACFY3N_17080 [Streptomyces sp. NPDC000348]|uniref:hypothetical protein n=1 Tax=Streptomyces sp. NPDC000348 TaxID=3364538 RepID=UPI003675F067
MAFAAHEDDPADGPGDRDRTTAQQTVPCEPELGPRPYVRLMTAVGAIGAVAAGVAALLGLSTVPALPFPVDVPTPPGMTDLPSGLPTGLPGGLPTDLPSRLPTGLPTRGPEAPPTGSLPTSVPSLPTSFPSLPDLPQIGGAS